MTMPKPKNKEEKKPSLLEIAKRQDYIRAVQKIQSGKPLTNKERAVLKDAEDETLSPAVVKTAQEAAKVLELSYRTLLRWKEEGMPLTKEGYYDLLKITEWQFKEREKRTEKQAGRDFWKQEMLKKQVAILEVRLKKESGELISRLEVERAQVHKVIALKRSFLSIPRRLAPILAGTNEPRETASILEDAINEIIDEFAGVRKRDYDEIEDTPKGQAGLAEEGKEGLQETGKNNGEPVGGQVQAS